MATLRRFLPLMGRILLSLVFIMSGVHKIMDWGGTADYMAAEGIPLPSVFLAGAVVFELVGGVSVLVGLKTRVGALLLVIFLIPTTLIFHDFWSYEGMEQEMQMINFMKNLSIMGGLFVVMGLGPGPLSVDKWKS